MSNNRGEDLFPRLDKEKFRQELREIYEETVRKAAVQRGEDPGDSGGASVREPRKPKPSSPATHAEVEVNHQ